MEDKGNSQKWWPIVIAVVALLFFITVCYFKFCPHSSGNEGTVGYYIANNHVFICAFIFVLFSLFNIRTFIADHWPLIFAVTIGLLVVAIYLHQFYDNPISSDPEKWGPFGDYIGGILNPTFTFVMLYLVWQTLVVQQKELELQKKTQEKLKEDLQDQRRDDRFFKYLDLYQAVVKGAYSYSAAPPVLPSLFNDTSWYPTNNGKGYQVHYNKHKIVVRNYLQIILVILRFLDRCPDKKKEEYASLFKAMLSDTEKVVLYCHCLLFATDNEYNEYKEVCELVENFLLTDGNLTDGNCYCRSGPTN